MRPVRRADNLTTFMCRSGSLDLLEPCGPVQACNGTALPLPITGLHSFAYSFGLLTEMKPDQQKHMAVVTKVTKGGTAGQLYELQQNLLFISN
jgi:hypothetical protein